MSSSQSANLTIPVLGLALALASGCGDDGDPDVVTGCSSCVPCPECFFDTSTAELRYDLTPVEPPVGTNGDFDPVFQVPFRSIRFFNRILVVGSDLPEGPVPPGQLQQDSQPFVLPTNEGPDRPATLVVEGYPVEEAYCSFQLELDDGMGGGPGSMTERVLTEIGKQLSPICPLE